MRRILEFFAQRHVLATLITVSILLLGLNSARTLKRDIVPEVDFGEVIITTTYPGASPEDVELNVTNKIEDELKEVTGIERITSTSMENLSVITVVIDLEVKDIEKVKDDIRDAVNRVTDFPDEVEESPLIEEIDTSQIPIVEVGLAGDLPYQELWELSKQFEKILEEVPGVARLEKYGYRSREVKILVNPEAMERYQIPLSEVVQAIGARNIRLTGGVFESYTSEKNVVTLAQFKEPVEVENVIVRSTFEGPLIRIRDLAFIQNGFEDERILSRMEGQDAISFLLYKTENADIIRTVKAVKKMILTEAAKYSPDEHGRVPERAGLTGGIISRVKTLLNVNEDDEHGYRYGPVKVLFAQDRSLFVQNRFRIVLTNGAIGLTFVVFILAVFLNLRSAFWVAMGIPVSILGAVFLLPFFGRFLDNISMFSLVLVIGIIVDDGIIISESISHRRSIGDSPLEAAVNGTSMVFYPVVTTVLTTFLAFAPMLFQGGVFGKFIVVIPITVSLALFISIGEAVFALPAHMKRGMERFAGNSHRQAVRKWFNGLRRFYRKFSYRFLKFRYPLFVLFVFVLVFTVRYAVRNMDFILFPTSGADRIMINVEMPTGTSLQATSEKAKEIESIVDTLPNGELDTFITRVGTFEEMGQAENLAFIKIGLTPYSERVRSADEIVEALRLQTSKLEGFEKITYIVQVDGPPVGRPVTIRLIGDDDETRRKLADEMQIFLSSLTGVKDIDRDDKLGKEQIEIKIDYTRLARLGLTVNDLAQNVRIAFDGEKVTDIREGDEDVEFRVQFAERAREDLQYLENLVIPNRQGRLIKVRDVAQLEVGPGPNAYRHFDRERSTTVTADVDKNVTSPIAVTMAAVRHFNLEKDWPGMRIKVGGEAEESQKSIMNLLITFIFAFIGIYFLLTLLFNSFSQPFLVMIAIPFGIIGVIITLLIHEEPLSFFAMIGTIGLAGVVVNDSLVLVSHLNELRRQKPRTELLKIVAEGTSNRLRAVILTSLTTIAGLLPLAYGIGGTDLFLAPMALALSYGLLFSTPLTLVLVPCLYVIWYDIGKIFRRSGKEI